MTNTYEHRVYESVDDRSLSWDTSQKIDGKQNSCSKGLNKILSMILSFNRQKKKKN